MTQRPLPTCDRFRACMNLIVQVKQRPDEKPFLPVSPLPEPPCPGCPRPRLLP